MAVFEVTVVGAVGFGKAVNVRYSTGLFITSDPDGPSEEQIEVFKRDIIAGLDVPAHEVTFQIGRREMSQEQLRMFAGHARTSQEISAPKPKPRPKPGPRTH